MPNLTYAGADTRANLTLFAEIWPACEPSNLARGFGGFCSQKRENCKAVGMSV